MSNTVKSNLWGKPVYKREWLYIAGADPGIFDWGGGGPDHRRVPKNNYIFEYPWNLIFKWQNAMRVSLKKISLLKGDIRSCRWKKFSLKQASGLIGGGDSRPSPWIRRWWLHSYTGAREEDTRVSSRPPVLSLAHYLQTAATQGRFHLSFQCSLYLHRNRTFDVRFIAFNQNVS